MGLKGLIDKEKSRIEREKNPVMIWECEKSDVWWTNTGSLDFVRHPRSRECLETGGYGLYRFGGIKKNGVRDLRNGVSGFLRSKASKSTGFVVWPEPGLFGVGSAAGFMPRVREGETGEVGMAGRFSLLYETVCLFCGAEVPVDDDSGCRRRTAIGLEERQRIGQAVHAGAVAQDRDSGSTDRRHRRDFDKKGAHLPDCGQRFGAQASDLVWRSGPHGRESGFVLSVAESQEIRENQACGHGHVEGFRELDEEECAEGRDSLRQVSCDPAFGRGVRQNPKTRICETGG